MRAMAGPTCASCCQFGYFAQALKAQLSQHDLARPVEHAGRRRVAQPDAIGRDDVQADAIGANGVRVERDACAREHLVVVTEDLDALVVGEHARDLRVDPGNRPELARPVGLVVRPGDPGRACGSHSAGIRTS